MRGKGQRDVHDAALAAENRAPRLLHLALQQQQQPFFSSPLLAPRQRLTFCTVLFSSMIKSSYFNPNCLYPAALAYADATGRRKRKRTGEFLMYLAKERPSVPRTIMM